MDYDFELEKAILKIKKNNAKRICIQLPDGLKPYAMEIAHRLEKETRCEILIWGGSCFGSCDIAQGLNMLGVDLLIQWGHSDWRN